MTDWVAEFNQRLAGLPEEFEDEREWHRLEWRERATEAQLRALESRSGFPVPAALRDLLLQAGPLQSVAFADSWETIQLAAADELLSMSNGLPAFIDAYWGGRPELEKGLSTDEIARLNSSTVVFGLRYLNDNEHEYFFYDRSGRFGTLFLDQDDLTPALEELRRMGRGEFDPETLPALLERQMSLMIEGMRELI